MRPRPPFSRILLALLFTISGLNQLVQVPGELFGEGTVPMLGLLHITAGLPGLATAWGAWFARPWAWIAALAWGVGTATLIASLERLLGLSSEDAQGLLPAALIVVVLALAAAWYLRRIAQRAAQASGNA